MIYLIFLFLIAGILLIVWSLANPGLSSGVLRERLATESASQRKPETRNYLLPLFGLTNIILDKLKLRESITRQLYASHLKLTAAGFFSIKLTLMLILAMLTAYGISAKMIPILTALAIGYFLPDFWLRQKINARKNVITRLFPELVDLLSLCMESGIDFTTAMDWIVRKTRPTQMIEELAFVLEEIRWGKPRSQALKDMAKRLNIPEVSSFAQTMVQAEKMGTPVVETFNIISEDIRLRRFHRGERLALQAPIKMLLPLIFCILPVIGIVIGGPILLQFMQGGIKGF